MKKLSLTADKKQYMRDYRRKKLAEDPEYFKRVNRAWYARHQQQQRGRAREQYRQNKWPRHLQQKYGISREEFERMLADQGGGCAICTAADPGGRGHRFHVDHCHKTGKVRQLLCNACNHMLGCARDRPNVLRAGADYLTRHARSG